jgi:hypothetical protein
MILHTLSINLETLEIEEYSEGVDDDYFEYEDGQVIYNEDGYNCVYSEASSKELVRRSVIVYCLEMSNAFNFAAQEVGNLNVLQ